MPREAFGHILHGGWRVLFVTIWGDGLLGGNGQHMAVQTQRIWEHIYLHRSQNVWLPQCFNVGQRGSDLKIQQCERHRGGVGAVRDHIDLCQWLGQAWVSSTE